MAYEAKNFEHLIGLSGFSEQLLKNHFTLYQGYVNNTNKLLDTFSTMTREGKTGTSEFAELKRSFGREFNGMRLHELYFGNLAKGGKIFDKKGKLFKKLIESFGSYETWEKDFLTEGAMRGIGWAVLYYDVPAGKLFNVWVNEHDVGHLSGAVPILVIDVFEHAFMLDYGLKRADYLTVFIRAVDWDEAEKRFSKAV